MVLGYHIIFGAYGFWLPNDPRGSWSTQVWAKHLQPFGPATKVTTRQSLASQSHDPKVRRAAKQALKYPAIKFTGLQARAVARGFSKIAQTLNIVVHACAIMPNHAHLVIARHCMNAERITNYLKRAATRQLNTENRHPLTPHPRIHGQTPSPWVTGGWCVYLNTPTEIQQRIAYVNQNPPQAGLPLQHWRFIHPYLPV